MPDKRIFGKYLNDVISKRFGKSAGKNACNTYRVLLYHSVGKIDPKDSLHTRVNRNEFQKQMSFMHSEGYNVLDLELIVEKARNKKTLEAGTVAITFDDGYKDNLEEAVPLMARFGYKPTIFITASLLGKVKSKRPWESWQYLSDDDIRFLRSSGCSIGSHSMRHLNLKRLKRSEALEEIAESKKILEEILHDKVSGFSFPYGRYNKMLIDMVKDAGYEFACTVVCGLNDASEDSFFSVKRTEINGFDDLDRFRMKLAGSFDWLGSLGMGV